MSDISARLRNGENRFLKWVYKQQYSGHPVISIPRHPDNIDALLADAADHIDALQAKLDYAEARFKDHGMQTLKERYERFPDFYKELT